MMMPKGINQICVCECWGGENEAVKDFGTRVYVRLCVVFTVGSCIDVDGQFGFSKLDLERHTRK